MEMKWFVLALAAVMYLLVICFQEKKVWITMFAAIMVVAAGMILPGSIFPLADGVAADSAQGHLYALFHSFGILINWNVLMIYVGSMTVAALFIYSRVPAHIADLVIDAAPSTGIAIVLILAMTGFISIFVENVATVLVMAPVALALCRKLKINPTYFMVGLAVMSNLEGTATLVGDPPSMIFASYAGYTFNDFFFHNGTISVFFIIQAGLIVGCTYFYFYFSDQKEKPEVGHESVVSYFPGVLLLVMIFGLAAISFIPTDFKYFSGSFVVTLGIIGILWYRFFQNKTGCETKTLIKELDWETIGFLIGVFIVVGAVSETGLLSDFASFLTCITGGSVFAGFILILVVSIIISGFVDNVPYIIVMLPVAGGLAHNLNIRPELYLFALLVGSCLGGNLTPFGASANIVAMGILKKENHPLSFGGWLRIGAPFTLLTTAAAAIILWLVWK